MTELSGILEGVGLPAIVRFLGGLSKTGCLDLGDGDWRGNITFEDGQITDAVLGSQTGLSALEAMVEVLQGARFVFESGPRAAREPTVRLERSSVLTHLDEAAARCARGVRRLPLPEAVPNVTATDSGSADEPLHLERASLLTLMAVDGQRSVREIIAHRGSIDVLWQLAALADVGLIRFSPATQAASVTRSAVATPIAASATPGAEANESPLDHCPRLGFEDDPSSSFGRPTRLHRCFAGDTPLPLSLDQQRELCLSDHFGTCPRLASAAPNTQTGQAVPAELPLRGIHGRPQRVAPAETEDGRIVRLRSIRNQGGDSGDVSDPTPLRPANAVGPSGPTPLRARIEHVPSVSAMSAAPGRAAAHSPSPATRQPSMPLTASPMAVAAPRLESGHDVRPPEHPSSAKGVEPHQADFPILLPTRRRLIMVAVGAAALLIVAALAYVLLPQLAAVPGSDNPDTATLPNAARIAAGTPVTDLPGVSITPAAVSRVQSTSLPQSAPAQRLTQSAPTSAAANPTAAPLFDERFTASAANWPSDPQGVAVITNGAYRIGTQQAGQFVAIGAPIAGLPTDVLVNATFRKLGGPSGGGYGIIVRSQDQNGLDGTTQDGHYYVLEAGDKGEVGIWRRDGDHWVDLLPWQHSDAVKAGVASNDLSVRAVGNTLSLSVNGTQVATRTDSTLTRGGAGLFVGGDGNDVAVSSFSIQTP